MATLKADPASLRAKATKINGEWPTVPESPVPPDQLALASEAAKQIVASRDRLNSVIEAGKSEAARLAACLEAAAKAYEQVDEIKKGEIESGQPSGSDAITVNPVLPEQVQAQPVANTGAPGNPYADWVDAAHQLMAANAAMADFAGQLYAFSDSITNRAKDFSPADTHWEGLAAEAAEGSLRQHESWLYEVAVKSRELADQARAFYDAHAKAKSEHPEAPADGELFGQSDYANYQHLSEAVRSAYSNEVTLQPVDTPAPPAGAYPPTPVFKQDVPPLPGKDDGQKPGQQGGGGGGGGGEQSGGSPSGEKGAVSPASAQNGAQQAQKAGEQSGSPSGGQGSGGSPSGGQGGGSPAGGAPSGLPEGLADLPTQPTLRPASADLAGAGGAGSGSGGGGGGGGGGGVPNSPLAPAAGASSPSASPTGVGTAPAGTAATGGGAMGGMGGGMPMGGAGMGQGQGGAKEKRRTPGLAPDEELYVEDRAYTESVIGLRQRRGGKDGQDKEPQ